MIVRIAFAIAVFVGGVTVFDCLASEPDDATRTVSDDESKRPHPSSHEPQRPVDYAFDKFVGVVYPRRAVAVVSVYGGTLSEVKVDIGDRVQQGEVIATVEIRDFLHTLKLAQMSLVIAQTELAKSTAELELSRSRRRKLENNSDAYSAQELEDVRFIEQIALYQMEAAQALVAERNVQVEFAQERIRQADIRAPFTGTVAMRYLDQGSIVLPTTPIVRIITADDLWVRLAMPQHWFVGKEQGSEVTFRTQDSGLIVRSEIRVVSPEVESTSGLVIAETQISGHPSISPGTVLDVLDPRP
ncbi:MAG: efflux RND transporter periplasmic adaptor subunit [Phycisphaerales bacterium]|nr:efflux RND transporter periplasmic adaptor subunit [Phycisphaerales bacterium]